MFFTQVDLKKTLQSISLVVKIVFGHRSRGTWLAWWLGWAERFGWTFPEILRIQKKRTVILTPKKTLGGSQWHPDIYLSFLGTHLGMLWNSVSGISRITNLLPKHDLLLNVLGNHQTAHKNSEHKISHRLGESYHVGSFWGLEGFPSELPGLLMETWCSGKNDVKYVAPPAMLIDLILCKLHTTFDQVP